MLWETRRRFWDVVAAAAISKLHPTKQLNYDAWASQFMQIRTIELWMNLARYCFYRTTT